MRRTGKAIGTLAAATSLAMIGGGLAFADGVVSDGDGDATVVTNQDWSVGEVCFAASDERSIPVAARRNGTANNNNNNNNNNVFKNGDTVSFSGTSANLAVEEGVKSVTLPPEWQSLAANTLSDSRNFTVRYTAPSVAGSFTHTATFTGTGINNANRAVVVTDTLTVSGTAKSCDSTEPTITDLGPTSSAAPSGWYTSAVTNTFKAEDSGSGLTDPADPTKTVSSYEFTKGSGAAEGSGVKIQSGTVMDKAGNTAASIDSAAFKIDLSNPTNVTFTDGPAAGSSHSFGSVPAAPTCTADDTVSGFKSCTVTGYDTKVGTHEMTATATDNAGRTATAKRSYTVLAWDYKGFYAPVDMGTTANTVKGGSTVPIKFEAFAGAVELTDIAVVKPLASKETTCNASDEDSVEVTTSGGTSVRYDPNNGGQFVYNWQTPKTAGKCYTVTIELADGSKQAALFKTR